MLARIALVKDARLLRLLVDQRGQAMVEYSTITFFMLIGGAAGGLAFFLPHFLNALNTYLGGIYYMMSLAIP